MNKSEIKVGMRVKMVKNHDFAKEGMVGVVVDFSVVYPSLIGVKFDKRFYGGHSLGGKCNYGHGQWVYSNDVEPVETVSTIETKYKPGDMVTVRSDLQYRTYKMADGKNTMNTTPQMLSKAGKKVKIKSVTKTGKYIIEGSIFPWVDEMFVNESSVNTTEHKSDEPKFKVGDRVRVRTDLTVGKSYYMKNGKWRDSFIEQMTDMKGKVVTISEATDQCYNIAESDWNWTDEMFEDKPVTKTGYCGKTVFIGRSSIPRSFCTVGKIYEFVDGRTKDDDGTIIPIMRPVDSLEDCLTKDDFIEIVE